MKIVNIEDFFHPSAGYQINALTKALAKKGHEVVILCAELEKMPKHLVDFFGRDGIDELDERFHQEYGVVIKRIPVRNYYSGRTFYAASIIDMVKKEKPDILFVHGNDSWSGMRFTLAAKKLGIPLILDSHMVSIATHNKFAHLYRVVYRAIFAPRINKYKIPVIRVQDDTYTVDELGIHGSNSPVISLGTDTDLFFPDEQTAHRMRKELGLENQFVIFYAGKLDESKGGLLLAEAIRRRFDIDDVAVVIVGTPSGDKQAELEELLSRCENTMVRIPTKKYIELPQYYQIADLVVFPAQCSLSFYDAQACGKPVLVDDSTDVNIQRVSHGNGATFSEGDVSSLRALLEKYIKLPKEDLAEQSTNALKLIEEGYAWNVLANKYEQLFEKQIH